MTEAMVARDEARRRKVGIFGAGMIGETLAELWASAGHDVMVSTRHPEQLEGLAARLGVRYGSVEEAAAFGEVVLLAVPFGAIPGLAEQVGGLLVGKVALDACNPFEQRDGEAARQANEAEDGSGVFTQAHLPGAQVVKAFNTVYFQKMREVRADDARLAVPLAGDDPNALRVAAELVLDAGMAPFVVGALTRSGRFDPGTPAWNSSATVAQLRALV